MRRSPIILAILAIGFAKGAHGQDAQRLLEEYGTQVTVYGERVPTHEKKLVDTPAPISVLTREQIQASGAKTVQEAIQFSPGVRLHDQTGNPVDRTIDLRGFPQGTSALVLLDGIRMNTLDDNGARLDLIPIEFVERIEIYRGASAPFYGGGALAGAINIITRKEPGIPRADLVAGAGSFGLKNWGARASGTIGQIDFFAAYRREYSSGYRENDGYDMDGCIAKLEWHAPLDQNLSILIKHDGGTLSQPGALTEDEMRRDRTQSPYNMYDGSSGSQDLASLAYSWSRGEITSFSAQAYARRSGRDTLTSGRYGMGFKSEYDEDLEGLVAEGYWSQKVGKWNLRWGAGGEVADGHLTSLGYYSSVDGSNPTPASSTAAWQRPWGVYGSFGARYEKFELSAGGRRDGVRYRYQDRFAPLNDVERKFQANTCRLSALYNAGENSSLYLSFAEGFKVPSVIDLFAYPGFFSNPDLKPTRSRDWELGWKFIFGGKRIEANLFRMRMSDEVVFVLTDPILFLGQNQNVGRSERDGAEIEGAMDLGEGYSLFGSAAYLKAKITAGPQAGKEVPMVPKDTISGGIQYRSPSWLVRLSCLRSGKQRLDNDLDNSRGLLPQFTVVNLYAKYTYRAFGIEVTVQNLMNDKYSSRGITNGFTDYFTPAYPLNLRVAATWSF